MKAWIFKHKTLFFSGLSILLVLAAVVVYVSYFQPAKEKADVIVPITGSSGTVNLACGSATILKLDNGGMVSFPEIDPCDLSVTVKPALKDELPVALPEGANYIDATTVTVMENGQALDTLPVHKKVTISFAQHVDEIGPDFLQVLHWDEVNGWQEVAFDSRLKAYSNQTGIFVLVKF